MGLGKKKIGRINKKANKCNGKFYVYVTVLYMFFKKSLLHVNEASPVKKIINKQHKQFYCKKSLEINVKVKDNRNREK